MRRVCLGGAAGLMLLAASFVTPAPAFAASGSRPPGPAGPDAVARAIHVTAPGVSRRSPATGVSVVCDGQFDAIASANGTGHTDLFGTAMVSGTDVWSVGIQTTSSNYDRTLAEHWNGTSSTVFPTVNPGPGHNDLFGVGAVSSTNVWAVGSYETNVSTHAGALLIEHWNGTSWSKITIKNPSTFASYLYAVTALSSTNVWAVGTYWSDAAGAYKNLVEHYNGSTWSVVASPNLGLSDTWDQLLAISAFSATDIWAVGSTEPSVGDRTSLAMHWNGSSWSLVSASNLAGGGNEILGVSALEAGHAVGVGYGGLSITSPAVAAQWDLRTTGDAVTMLPFSATGDVVLEGVARSSGHVWAVGFSQTTPTSARQTLVWPATWDASAHTVTWASAPGVSASPGSNNNALFTVDAVSPSVFWAAGYSNSGGFDQSLTDLYCALHFAVTAPATVVPGSPFAVTVTAKNSNSSTATDYGGTVHFTSGDPQAALPADYTFAPGDSGAHTFTGVVLKDTSHPPSMLMVSDTLAPFISGSAAITVACAGVCQSPPGTPGSRDVLPGPTPGPPGTRVPIRPAHLAAPVRHSSEVIHSAASAVAAKAGQRTLASDKSRAVVKAAQQHTGGVLVALQSRERVSASQQAIASPREAPSPLNVEGAIFVGLLVFALLAFRLRRRGEESSVHNQA